jgi:hypothetical protein
MNGTATDVDVDELMGLGNRRSMRGISNAPTVSAGSRGMSLNNESLELFGYPRYIN